MGVEEAAVRLFVEDVEAALVDVGLSHKAACIAMDLDPATWTRLRQTGRVDARRLAALGDAFERAFTKRRALRMGLRIEDSIEGAQAERVRAALHAVLDAIEILPVRRAS